MSITPTPSDNTTLTAVLAGYAAAGFDGDFVVDGEQVRCQTCQAVASPSDLELHSLRRLEGASDPADMSAILALSCPGCGRQGTMVVRFGPEASAAEGDLLRDAQDRRFDDEQGLPAAAPTEPWTVSGSSATAPYPASARAAD